MPPLSQTLEPLFEDSDEAEYIGGDFELRDALQESVETHTRDIVVAVRNLMPPSETENTVPLVQSFTDWDANDFAEYHLELTMSGSPNTKVSNNRWHASQGYLLEFIHVLPLVEPDDDRPFTELRFRAFKTCLDTDPLAVLREWPDEEKQEVDTLLKSTNRNLLSDATTVLVDIKYYHETDDESQQ